MAMAKPNRLQTICIALSTLFIIMLGHTLKLSYERSKLMANFKLQMDSDGDEKLSSVEIAKWAAKTFQPKEGKNGDGSLKYDAKKFLTLVNQFDVNNDKNLNDQEMFKIFDMLDEIPNASKEMKLLGGDNFELEFILTLVVGALGMGSLFLLYYEAFSTARFVNSLNDNLQLQKREYQQIQRDMLALQNEAKELEEKLKLSNEDNKSSESTKDDHEAAVSKAAPAPAPSSSVPSASSLNSNSSHEEKGQKLTKSFSAVAAAAAAKWRLIEVKKSLHQKSVEITEAKAQAKVIANEMEEKLSEFSFQSEKLKLMQHCLSLGLDKYQSEGACLGFALQQGSIFGSLTSSSSSLHRNNDTPTKDDIWRVTRELGTGRRGAFVVKSLSSNKEMAMKRYDLYDKDSSVKSELVAELRTNATIGKGHPHIVQYEQIIETERYVFVLMELIGAANPQKRRGMDLFDFITVERSNIEIEEKEAKLIFKQLISALQFLHNNQVIHGDIKPENVMLEMDTLTCSTSSGNISVKLIDFGCACFLRHSTGDERNIWDSYSPPEVYAGGVGMGIAVDMYRLGATLYTTLQKCPPSQGISPQNRRQGIFNTNYRWKSLSVECRDLITTLLAYHPADRPKNCEQVLKHAWFSTNDKSDELSSSKTVLCPESELVTPIAASHTLPHEINLRSEVAVVDTSSSSSNYSEKDQVASLTSSLGPLGCTLPTLIPLPDSSASPLAAAACSPSSLSSRLSPSIQALDVRSSKRKLVIPQVQANQESTGVIRRKSSRK